ncbi:myosin-4 isoform X2 [Agrilus planipennis]|uniref:Myosin-4 isoform X2 n=1 Tax=Agrilus planipennis TaxID=224129 RepID=A0A7F5RIZ0_AGRPL|nr:myosin-4 isoform X2 [Agrilus planipennis]
MDMSAEHTKEIAKLKEEHIRNLNRAIKRRSLKENSLIQEELDILQERDNLRKCTSILRIVVTHLMKYFSECENELNNSLLEEILKRNLQSSKSVDFDDKLSVHFSSSSCSKRVHITPNVTEILATIDDSIPLVDVNINELSVDLENELSECLGKLRDEANDILALTASIHSNRNKSITINERISSLTRQPLDENTLKEDLTEKLNETEKYVRSLENERINLDNHIEQLLEKQRVLENDLMYAKEKIAQMMDKEVVSEGYGEIDECYVSNFGEEVVSFNEVQEKARAVLGEDSPDCNRLMQLVEDLCRAGEKLKTEAQKEHIDLKQQIEAADKKIRATAKFLEEQASEREQERDEALKEIILLKDLLKERERDRNNCEQINKEVEHLEHQMREMSKLVEDNESRTKEIELEKEEAIDKICVLRDIIRDLEVQIEAKTATEKELKQLVDQLQQIIEQQNKSNEDLHQQLNSMQNVEHIQEHVEKLENEMQNLRLNAELIGKEGLLHQIKTELTDLEVNLEKRTCDLEALHAAVSGTNCSSPSEDMSVRDQIRPRAPSLTLEECHIPLQQLARLKEKLLVHSRAEDAAMKKIRDLEMQLDHIKHELEESQNEKDILQDQVSQQLILISNLQMRLDEQRLRTEQVQKQNNTSLEVHIYDLENEIQTLKEIIQNRDKTIKHLTTSIEQTKQRLEDREKELLAKTEDIAYVEQQKQIEKLQEENEHLKVKLNCDNKNAQILPSLVDNIIADKNKDIDMLRSKLNDTQRELESFLSLNLDKEQLKSLSSIKSSEQAVSDLLSLTNNKELEQVRKAEQLIANITTENLPKPIFKRNNNETVIYMSHEESKPKISEFDVNISEIEHIGRVNVDYTNEDMSLIMQSHSTQLSHIPEKKRVHFSNTEDYPEVDQLKKEISVRDEIIKDFTERLKILSNLEINLEDLQVKLEVTENLLKQTTSNFELETERFSEIEKDLRSKLHQNDKELMEKNKELILISEDSKRKDEMYLSLAEEKRNLEKKLDEIQNQIKHCTTLNEMIEKQKKHIASLEAKLAQMQDLVVNLEDEVVNTQKAKDKLNEELTAKAHEVENKTEELKTTKAELICTKELNEKQGKEVTNKEKEIYSLMEDLKEFKYKVEAKENQILEIQKKYLEQQKSLNIAEEKLKELQSLLNNRETEIGSLNKEINRFHEQNEILGNKEVFPDHIKDFQTLKLSREIAEKDLKIVKYSSEIDDLKYEINNLQHLLQDKEKVITQISEDSKSLHVNLETIQNKMREGGNVFDLKKRLHEEQQLNAVLTEQLNLLKIQSKNSEREDMVVSIEEITGQVQKQLNYSALLDSNIISALSNDDRQSHLNDADYFKDSLILQKEINKRLQLEKEQLQEKLSALEENYQLKKDYVDKLEFLFEKEKREFNCMQLENAGILEQMRLQLETALKNEMEFEELLQKERISHKETENQLAILKVRLTNSNISDNSKTEYKSLPSAQFPELIMLRNSLESLEKENQMLKVDLKAAKKERSETITNLKYLKEMLQFKNNEIEKLEQKIFEIKRNHDQLEKEYIQTKANLNQRSTEIENSRILINELEGDGRVMKKQIEDLHEKLRVAEELKIVPDKFLKKIDKLKHEVRQQVKDNKLMTETLSKLANERQQLQLKVNELEACSNMPFTDLAARANHLFARYLKSESNKKALVWQKRYLISLLATYQDFRLTTTLPSSTFEMKINKSKHTNTKRFKILAISVIVVIRMQYLVRRWQSGKRFGAHLPSSRKYDIPFNKLPTHFQTDQFESHDQVNHSAFIFQQSNSNPEAQSIHIENPVDCPNTNTWLAVSPSIRKKNLDADHNGGNCSCPPGSPNFILTQYLERFDQIQKRLAIAAEDNIV